MSKVSNENRKIVPIELHVHQKVVDECLCLSTHFHDQNSWLSSNFFGYKLMWNSNHSVPCQFLYILIRDSSGCILTFSKFIHNFCRKLTSYVMNGFRNRLFLLLIKICTMNHQCWKGDYIFSCGSILIYFYHFKCFAHFQICYLCALLSVFLP